MDRWFDPDEESVADGFARLFRPLNTRRSLDAVYTETLEFLEHDSELSFKLHQSLHAAHMVGKALPGTLDRLFSGDSFPYAQAYEDLESSYQIAHFGLYRQAFVSLRSALELGLAQVYFDAEDNAPERIRPWLEGRERTPTRSAMFTKAREIPRIAAFDDALAFQRHFEELMYRLDGYAHTRGFGFSTMALNRSNIPLFSKESLLHFIDAFVVVVHDIVVLMALRYPLALQPLPVAKKLGLGGPISGFLSGWEAASVRSVLSAQELDFLDADRQNDPEVVALLAWFEKKPDITDEELREQAQRWDELMSSNNIRIHGTSQERRDDPDL